MNYSKLIETLQLKCGLTYAQAEDVVYGLVNDIAESLLNGEEVRIHGFGTFKPKQRSGRLARNPKTGDVIHVAPKLTVAFKAASKLREAVQ